MIFYGNGVVWDKRTNKRLCKFVNGELDTDDARVIEILTSLNYRSDGVAETVEGNTEGQTAKEEQTETQADYEEMTIAELRDSAKDRGLTGIYKMSKSELIDALKG